MYVYSNLVANTTSCSLMCLHILHTQITEEPDQVPTRQDGNQEIYRIQPVVAIKTITCD